MSEPVATYHPELDRDIDWMRFRLFDKDVVTPFEPDVTYLAHIAASSGDWRLAAAAMARGFASRAAEDLQSYTAVGDFSSAWRKSASDWLRIANELEAEAARLTPSNDGSLWSATVSRSDLEEETSEYSIDLRR